ncbi:MAG: hypothetical protein ACREQY_13695, partial [Candidatus Binatia bacterium]
PLTDAEAAPLAAFVAEALNGGSPAAERLPPRLRRGRATVLVTLRSNGRLLESAWHEGAGGADAIVGGLHVVREKLRKDERPDAVVLDLARSFEVVELEGAREALRGRYRGVRGLELLAGGGTRRAAPTEMIAANVGFEEVLDGFLSQSGLRRDQLTGYGAIARVFEADQVLVRLTKPPGAVRMVRGNRLVEPDDVTQASVTALGKELLDWLVRDVDDDGRFSGGYRPTPAREIGARPAREWLATLALTRAARASGDPAMLDRSERAIRANLWRSYREDEDSGLIVSGEEVRLDAVALAALTILEHPRRQSFARQESMLLRTVDRAWSADGSFRTFYRPSGRPDEPNAGSGEALFLWATLLVEKPDPELLRRFLESFRYYRAWHVAHQHPAFVPWHTLAFARAWWAMKNAELASFVFDMNDWLAGMQQWDGAAFPELRGRFYDPKHPYLGPPSSATTAGGLQALLAAHRLATAVGDSGRAGAYWSAVLRGFRSLLQVAFLDEVDVHYVRDRRRVQGGLRRTVYDNVIRT